MQRQSRTIVLELEKLASRGQGNVGIATVRPTEREVRRKGTTWHLRNHNRDTAVMLRNARMAGSTSRTAASRLLTNGGSGPEYSMPAA